MSYNGCKSKFGVEGYIAMIKETEAKELRKIRVNPVLRMIP